MDWKTFIIELIKATAWPIVVVIIAYHLKDKIAELLPRIRKFKHKDTELEFAEGVSKLVQAQETAHIDNIEISNETAEKYEFLMRLSDISPRAAVLEAFREIEHASALIISKHPNIKSAHGSKNMISIQKQLASTSLSDHEVKMFNQLKTLRNKAAHDREFNLYGMPIEAYIDLSLTLASRIKHAEAEL